MAAKSARSSVRASKATAVLSILKRKERRPNRRRRAGVPQFPNCVSKSLQRRTCGRHGGPAPHTPRDNDCGFSRRPPPAVRRMPAPHASRICVTVASGWASWTGGVACAAEPKARANDGLVVILHNDADVPFPKPDQEPWMLVQFKELLMKHPNTTIIWAHAGLGRIVRPVKDQLGMLDRALANPGWGAREFRFLV
jgi:hypothetical protein